MIKFKQFLNPHISGANAKNALAPLFFVPYLYGITKIITNFAD